MTHLIMKIDIFKQTNIARVYETMSTRSFWTEWWKYFTFTTIATRNEKERKTFFLILIWWLVIQNKFINIGIFVINIINLHHHYYFICLLYFLILKKWEYLKSTKMGEWLFPWICEVIYHETALSFSGHINNKRFREWVENTNSISNSVSYLPRPKERTR